MLASSEASPARKNQMHDPKRFAEDQRERRQRKGVVEVVCASGYVVGVAELPLPFHPSKGR